MPISRVSARYASEGFAAVLLALPAIAAAGQGGPVASLAAQQCAQERADLGKKAFHKRYGAEARDAQLHQADSGRGRGGRQLGDRETARQELAESGRPGSSSTTPGTSDTVDDAMSECMDLTLDDLLTPDGSGDDESDDDCLTGPPADPRPTLSGPPG